MNVDSGFASLGMVTAADPPVSEGEHLPGAVPIATAHSSIPTSGSVGVSDTVTESPGRPEAGLAVTEKSGGRIVNGTKYCPLPMVPSLFKWPVNFQFMDVDPGDSSGTLSSTDASVVEIVQLSFHGSPSNAAAQVSITTSGFARVNNTVTWSPGLPVVGLTVTDTLDSCIGSMEVASGDMLLFGCPTAITVPADAASLGMLPAADAPKARTANTTAKLADPRISLLSKVPPPGIGGAPAPRDTTSEVALARRNAHE